MIVPSIRENRWHAFNEKSGCESNVYPLDEHKYFFSLYQLEGVDTPIRGIHFFVDLIG